MKHLRTLSKTIPAKAQFEHPNISDSIDGFLADPIGVLAFHIRILLNKEEVIFRF